MPMFPSSSSALPHVPDAGTGPKIEPSSTLAHHRGGHVQPEGVDAAARQGPEVASRTAADVEHRRDGEVEEAFVLVAGGA